MSGTSIPPRVLDAIAAMLAVDNTNLATRFPGDGGGPQPVHTVYGGAHLFRRDVARKLGAAALKTLEDHAPDAERLARAIDLRPDVAAWVYPRIVQKLNREPVEDFRIDFEDGFGHRSEEEEDQYARAAAEQVAAGMAAGTLPPSIGIRIKAFSEALKWRSLRTLDLFVTRLLEASAGRLPPMFVITLPKITSPLQVAGLSSACDALERAHALPGGSLRIELMVETPQAIFAPDGVIALSRLLAEGDGRIVSAHFGAFDYTASLAITAAHQHLLHPACDFARHVMQVALAGTGVRLSDSVTTILPVGPHPARARGSLTKAQRLENTEVVHQAWRLHARHIRHALEGGFYQGWDLHPAQIPARYAAVYAFFYEGLDAASSRLRHFVARAAQATLARDVFDDAATGQGLLNYFLQATACGALTDAEAVERSGLSLDELRGRSFLTILTNRRGL